MSIEMEPMAVPRPHMPETVDEAVCVVASHPARILALVALAELQGESATAYGIIERLNAATGQTPYPAAHDMSVFGALCSKSLAPHGYVNESIRMSVPVSGHTPQRATVFFITPKGMDALAPAGAIARWEADHSQLSARDLLGSVRTGPDGALRRGTTTRLAVLSRLVDEPDGCPTTLLEKACGDSAGLQLRQLTNLDILQMLSKSVPAHRRLRVIAPDLKNKSSFMSASPEARALYIAAAHLVRAGKTELNGAELLQVVERSSSQEPRAVWQALVKNQPMCLEFVDADIFGGSAYHNTYRLAPEYRQTVADFTGAVSRLRQSSDFWDESYDYAAHLLEDGQRVAYLLAKAFRKSCSVEDDGITSEQIVLEAIPEQGIAERDLLASVMRRRRMSLATLRSYLAKSNNVAVEKIAVPPSGSRRVGWVSRWAGDFPADWGRRAACANKGSGMFFAVDVAELSAPQVEQAKRICRSCPVRPACLKTAVGRREKEGIWGGFTWEERRGRSLPADIRIGLSQVTVL